MSDPFLERLKARAATAPAPPAPPPSPPPGAGRGSASGAPRGPTMSSRDRRAVAFWQNSVAQAFIRARITGDEDTRPSRRFAGLVEEPLRAGTGVALRGGDPALVCELIRDGAFQRATILDGSEQRLGYARARIPGDLRDRVELVHVDPLAYTPPEPAAAVVAVGTLHRLSTPEEAVARIAGWLEPGGLVYVDEFVGPDHFQWTDRQVDIVNRLLSSLPDELRRDLTDRSGSSVKERIGRPDRARFVRDHPEEAVGGSRVRDALDAHLQPVSVKPYGGAVFHQLFARIMGNFARRPELVRLVLEFDAILTDLGVVGTDYLWAAYRRPHDGAGGSR